MILIKDDYIKKQKQNKTNKNIIINLFLIKKKLNNQKINKREKKFFLKFSLIFSLFFV